MQRELSKKVQLGENLSPLKDLPKVLAIDNTSDLKDVFRKVNKLCNLREDSKMDYNLIKYLPGLATVSRQRQIYNIIPKKLMPHLATQTKKRLNLIFYWYQMHTPITTV